MAGSSPDRCPVAATIPAPTPVRPLDPTNSRVHPAHPSRRALLAGAAGATLAAIGCGQASPPPAPRPSGVPVSPFTPDSTTDDVIAGLDLRGRLMIVTGATSGLGLETVRALAATGADVVATGRTVERAREATAAVAPRAIPVALDLERWDTVVAAAETIRALQRPVDTIVCNAGLMNLPALELAHGLEKHFVVNHLGHYLFVRRLLDRVRDAQQGRVVVVSSAMLALAPAAGINFENLDGSRGYEPAAMYGQSKLANALFAFELARREAGTRVTANTLHPGVANTNLDRAQPAWRRLTSRALAWSRPYVRPIEVAAATQVYLATAPALAQTTGRYFEDCNAVVPPGRHAGDAQLAAALWDRSEALVRDYLV